MKLFLGSIAALILLTAQPVCAQNLGPAETVRAFYKYSNSRSSTFNRRHIELRRKWYTSALYDAFVKQLREDEFYLKKHPSDKPFFGDGLTFRPLDEPCMVNGVSHRRVQSVGRTEIERSKATVEIIFAYPKGCTEGAEPIVYRIALRKTGANWLIDDLAYPDGLTLTRSMAEHKYE